MGSLPLVPPGKPPLYIENSKYTAYVVIKVKYKDYIRLENFLKSNHSWDLQHAQIMQNIKKNHRGHREILALWILPRICIFEFTKTVLMFSNHIFFTSPLENKVLLFLFDRWKHWDPWGLYELCKDLSPPFLSMFSLSHSVNWYTEVLIFLTNLFILIGG